MKHIKLYKEHLDYHIRRVDKYKSLLLNGDFYYIIGSMSSTQSISSDHEMEKILTQMIFRYFTDQQFIINNFYGEDRKLFNDYFNKNIIEPYLISYFDVFKNKYMEKSKPYSEGKPIYWTIKKDFNDEEFFDKFMLRSELPKEMIDKYIKYRKSYAGDDITTMY
tara:strand:- start:2701 stop:3192 length:492 start_codon:yes stop_codon:yes gene_type:complete